MNSARSTWAMSCISRPVNAIGMAPRRIRQWGTSRSQPSAVKPHTDSPALSGLAYDGLYRLSRAWQAGVAAVRPECHSGPRAPASPGPIQPASGKERSPTGISGPKKIIARPRAKSVIITYECTQFRSEFAADSPLEEDGFELASFREGKGYGQPLQASIAVSDLNL